MKRAVCIKCGKGWNISKFAKIEKDGYICPHCRKKQKLMKILQFLLLVAIGVICWWHFGNVAYAQRGYEAIGGEVVFLALPLVYYIFVGTMQEIADSYNELFKEVE